jgi:drug/metabolite transporter (DMT)-like permease
MKTPARQGILAVSLGSIFLGSVGVFVRLASKAILPMTQTFGRIFTAFLVISLFNLLRGKLKSDTFAIKKKNDLLFFLLNGLVGFSLMAVSFTLSVLYTSITNAYFLLYTAPIFAVILSALFLKEKITRHILLSISISFLGLIFLFNPTNLTQNLLGNLFGLLTGISFGSYFVLTGYLGRSYSSPTITFWTQLFGALGIFPLIFIFDKTLSPSFYLADWLPVIGAGIVVFTGYLLLNFGLTKIKASVGSVLSLFEPLSSIVYGLIFFAEFPERNTLIGAVLIVSSILYLTKHQVS